MFNFKVKELAELLNKSPKDVANELPTSALVEVLDSDVVKNNPTLLIFFKRVKHEKNLILQEKLKQLEDDLYRGKKVGPKACSKVY